LYAVDTDDLIMMTISQREGQYPLPPGASPILGVEFAGVVEELGKKVTKWSKGNEVLGLATGVSTW
jgi:NADPH:quinone reductase-like Zn-dependent oxidoreductase